MNSPWGYEISVIKETGWTRHYLLWKISWISVKMMIADAPTFKREKKSEEKKLTTQEELEDFFR